MKIVNRVEFLKLPAGTLFCKYTPNLFGDLEIKESNPEDDWSPDFLTTTISGSGLSVLGCDSPDQCDYVLTRAAEKGTEFRIDYDCASRDGYFDEDQLFAVYDKEDIQMLVDRLNALIVQNK